VESPGNPREVKESSVNAAVVNEHGPLKCLGVSKLPDPAVGDVREAMEKMETAKQFGKIVIGFSDTNC